MDFIIKPLQNHNRSAIRKQWSDEQMKGALNSVLEDGVPTNKAAVIHRVLRSTLKDRLSGRVIHGNNSGPDLYLNVEKEKEQATHLIDAANIGYGKTWKDVLGIVQWYVEKKNVSLQSYTVTNGW